VARAASKAITDAGRCRIAASLSES